MRPQAQPRRPASIINLWTLALMTFAWGLCGGMVWGLVMFAKELRHWIFP